MNDKKIYKINNIDVQDKKIGSFLGESKYYFSGYKPQSTKIFDTSFKHPTF